MFVAKMPPTRLSLATIRPLRYELAGRGTSLLRVVSYVQVGGIGDSTPSRLVPLGAICFTVFCVQIRGQFNGLQHDGIAPYFAGQSNDHDTVEYDNRLSDLECSLAKLAGVSIGSGDGVADQAGSWCLEVVENRALREPGHQHAPLAGNPRMPETLVSHRKTLVDWLRPKFV